MLNARRKISRCITNKSSPASNTGSPCSALKKKWTKRLSHTQKCWGKRLRCQGACIPPQAWGRWEAGVHWAGQSGGTPTSKGSQVLSGIGSPSAPRRTAQQPSQTAPEPGNPSPQTAQTRSGGHWTIPGIWHAYGFCHPPGKSAQDHLMETSYNWPPEIFWLATVFQADKRGICESTLRVNKVLFNSVKLLNLP